MGRLLGMERGVSCGHHVDLAIFSVRVKKS